MYSDVSVTINSLPSELYFVNVISTESDVSKSTKNSIVPFLLLSLILVFSLYSVSINDTIPLIFTLSPISYFCLFCGSDNNTFSTSTIIMVSVPKILLIDFLYKL